MLQTSTSLRRQVRPTLYLLRRRYVSSLSLLDELDSRGLLQAVTSRAVRQHLNQPRAVYLGVDPSARSLHVGNLLALVGLLHFQLHGHKAIALIGGATGRVGDPSGRSSERNALSEDVLDSNITAISSQVRTLFTRGVPFAAERSGLPPDDTRTTNVLFANNNDWIGRMSLLEFLSGPGKRARVSVMLARDSVKSRLSSSSGISFTEFSYQLLQAYDFYHLHRTQGCTIQLGGSDQWGNIQSGIDLIRREATSQAAAAIEPVGSESAEAIEAPGNAEHDAQQPAYGLTFPLLTTSNGEKFGKSAGNAVWLDPSMTSPFEFYQFFLRTADPDVGRYLKIFSFLSLEHIDQLLEQHNASPQLRQAQHLLAAEVTELVHGKAGLRQAIAATKITFGTSDGVDLAAEDILYAFRGSSQLVKLPLDQVVNQPLTALAVQAGLSTSKSNARQALTSGGFALNQKKVEDAGYRIQQGDLLDGRVLTMRIGKTALRVVEIQ